MEVEIVRIKLGNRRIRVAGRLVPIADLGERLHHRLCPTHPGERLPSDTICCDCVYGSLAEKRRLS